MSITLTKGTTSIELPIDLIWSDELAWSPVEQSVAMSITGAMIIDTSARTNGRPITLSGDQNHAWMPYSIVSQLRAWADDPTTEMTLSIGSSSYTVIFRHNEKPAIDVTPVIDYSVRENSDYFYGTLKFLEV